MTRVPASNRPRPSDAVLAERLTASIDPGGAVKLLDRAARGSGTFPKEIVRCRLQDGSERVLFCKYAAPRADAYGHRGGVSYEAEVYQRVLTPSTATTPLLAGAYLDEESGEHSLFLEFLEDGERLKNRWRQMDEAARWLGGFHREHERASERDDLSFLTRYDEGYYLGWARRTAEYASRWHQSVPWLASLCDRFSEVVPVLLTPPETVIHGEYTVKNVMLRGTEVHPTDWESAAIAAGEIDVMCLVDGWPEATAEKCVHAYAAARWREEVPSGFDRRLRAAEVYLHFRWLGEHPNVMVSKPVRRFDRLHVLARELALLP